MLNNFALKMILKPKVCTQMSFVWNSLLLPMSTDDSRFPVDLSLESKDCSKCILLCFTKYIRCTCEHPKNEFFVRAPQDVWFFFLILLFDLQSKYGLCFLDDNGQNIIFLYCNVVIKGWSKFGICNEWLYYWWQIFCWRSMLNLNIPCLCSCVPQDYWMFIPTSRSLATPWICHWICLSNTSWRDRKWIKQWTEIGWKEMVSSNGR